MSHISLKTVRARKPGDVFKDKGFNEPKRPSQFISFEDLPVAKKWENGRTYTLVKIVKQIASDENGVTLETQKVGGGDVKGTSHNGSRHSRRKIDG